MSKGPRKFIISPRREIKEFFTMVSIQMMGVAMINIFEPIYLYTIGISPAGIALFYLAAYVPYFFILPIGGRIAKSFGFEHTLTVSTLFSIAYYLALVAIPASEVFLYIAPFLFMTQKMLWWPAYHANFAKYSKKKETGREIGISQTIFNITAATGPLLGGAILAFSNFTVLYIIVVALMLLSAIPLFTTKEKFKPSSLGWVETMKHIFSQRFRKKLFTGLGFGEEIITYTLWPLFIFLVLGTALKLGVVIAVSTVLTTAITMIAAYWSDKHQRSRVMWWAVVANALSWIGRPFITALGSILGFDAVSRASRSAMFVPMYSKVYDEGKKNHVMIEVVSFEAVLAIGKVLGLAAMAILYPLGGFPAVFAAGAVFSLFYFFFSVDR